MQGIVKGGNNDAAPVVTLTGDAVPSDVVNGKGFYSDDPNTKQVGTLALSSTAGAGDIINGKTAYLTDPKTPVTGTLALSGTATAPDILNGKTAYTTDPKTPVTGSLTSKVGSNTVITPSASEQAIPQGYYGGAVGDGKVAGDVNLSEGNIKKGVSIFGKVGTALTKPTLSLPSGRTWSQLTQIDGTYMYFFDSGSYNAYKYNYSGSLVWSKYVGSGVGYNASGYITYNFVSPNYVHYLYNEAGTLIKTWNNATQQLVPSVVVNGYLYGQYNGGTPYVYILSPTDVLTKITLSDSGQCIVDEQNNIIIARLQTSVEIKGGTTSVYMSNCSPALVCGINL